MGYWGDHPLAGDTPADAVCYIWDHIVGNLMSKRELSGFKDIRGLKGRERYNFEVDELVEMVQCTPKGKRAARAHRELLARAINRVLPKLVEDVKEGEVPDVDFELPFMVADEFAGMVRPEVLDVVEKDLVDMIGDGGAFGREYGPRSGPAKYANALRKSFRATMLGERTAYKPEVGLLGEMAKVLSGERKPGKGTLLNVK